MKPTLDDIWKGVQSKKFKLKYGAFTNNLNTIDFGYLTKTFCIYSVIDGFVNLGE